MSDSDEESIDRGSVNDEIMSQHMSDSDEDTSEEVESKHMSDSETDSDNDSNNDNQIIKSKIVLSKK